MYSGLMVRNNEMNGREYHEKHNELMNCQTVEGIIQTGKYCINNYILKIEKHQTSMTKID